MRVVAAVVEVIWALCHQVLVDGSLAPFVRGECLELLQLNLFT